MSDASALSEKEKRQREQREYAILFNRTVYEERRYNEIEQKINNEIIALLLREYALVAEEKDNQEKEYKNLVSSKEEVDALTEALEERTQIIAEKEKEIKELVKQKKDLETQIKKIQKNAEEQKKEIEEKEKYIQSKEDALKVQLTKKEEELVQKKKELEQEIEIMKGQAAEIEQLKNLLQSRTSALEEKQVCIAEKETRIETLEAALVEEKKRKEREEEQVYKKERDLKRKIEELEDKLAKHPSNAPVLVEEIAKIRMESEVSKAKVEEKDRTITILQSSIQRLEDLLNKHLQMAENRAAAPSQEMISQLIIAAQKDKQQKDKQQKDKENKLIPAAITTTAAREQIFTPIQSIVTHTDKKIEEIKPETQKKSPRATATRRKAKGEKMDFAKEISKTAATKKRKEEEKITLPSPVEEKKKDFSTLFSKSKRKEVFAPQTESSSFFAELSFSEYESEGKDKR